MLFWIAIPPVSFYYSFLSIDMQNIFISEVHSDKLMLNMPDGKTKQDFVYFRRAVCTDASKSHFAQEKK